MMTRTQSNPHRVRPKFWERFTQDTVRDWVVDAHRRSVCLVDDLSDEQLLGPRLATVNPLMWEWGHVTWFYEFFLLRGGRDAPSRVERADELYDSAKIPHHIRWDLPLLARRETSDYAERIREQILEVLEEPLTDETAFLLLMCLFHEDMHHEAYVINRQAWGYRRPGYCSASASSASEFPGDVEIPGGTFLLGAASDAPFVFDNEKWEHPVSLEAFRISRAPVTQAEFVGFVEDDGYSRRQLWTDEGWQWRERNGRCQPVYWEKRDGAWWRRDFEEWVRLEPNRPVVNVCWHEANAYCRWAGRRLPTEPEWEAAASLSDCGAKCCFPWGEDFPDARLANLDGFCGGAVDVGDLSESDSPRGCRQMIGNVWEWTSTDFQPYPGFVSDPYAAYSQPWFGDHKVLRGGSWLTRSRLIRSTWRNYYKPERCDVWAGFRTCASARE